MSVLVKPPVPPKTTWKPGKADELSFDEGDLLYVYDRDTDPNWWRAKCGDQKRLIPVTYVEEQTQEIDLPLHDAARRGNISFLREYLKEGISGTGLDAAGNTPLYWAARTGHLECAKELLTLPNPVVNARELRAELKKESLKLEEHTNSKGRWWDWFIMIAYVLGVFFSMVLCINMTIQEELESLRALLSDVSPPT
ncbi:PREDICTED: osteoclast-stimulating factor 1-like isoform X2 [Vollenhovia emeryi]|uniref:osteoclast-stimulating factor 1-like isoform X2 n=1 Tax=Vollenhovia emeryi TaxID=411798 RepID=UPI0005F46805|nr:PREDICTED: osteoclast-stimulating factor 1-like isoform X2 [Vollenhovia emeryi]